MIHLSDDDLQALAEGTVPRPEATTHLAGCALCQAEVASYEQIGEALSDLDRPLPPLDFTESLLARLPAPAPRVSADDLLAVIFATGAAMVASVLFRASNGASVLFQAFHRLPGKAVSEAVIAASLHSRGQVSVLMFLSIAVLLIGAPLWRLMAPPRVVA